MDKTSRLIFFFSQEFFFIFFFYVFQVIIFPGQLRFLELLYNPIFILVSISYFFTSEEMLRWALHGKRSEISDIVFMIFFFFIVFYFSESILTSIMGAFSIYLWFSLKEVKEYPIIIKILLISLITYNVIFIAGLFSVYLKMPLILNISFAFSFWIILILGVTFFGRKYLIVWRFFSPQYLILFLYIIAWFLITFINQYTPLELKSLNVLNFAKSNLLYFFLNIYFIIIIINWVIYFFSGVILDRLLGIKATSNNNLISIVSEVKDKMNIRKKIKIGIGKYPIINAMAYGPFFDKRIALIIDNSEIIHEDELKGIIAHELAHSKSNHTLILTGITTIDLLFRMIFGIPATVYDYIFSHPELPLMIFIIFNIFIYMFIFTFIKVLEGFADLKAKKFGFGTELVKALFTLESFYLGGKEFGFNMMLLCDEKINNYNKELNYYKTARYINQSLIKPSRISLLNNFLNSHPLTYLRIASLLSDVAKPFKQAIFPFLFVKKSYYKKVFKYYGDLTPKFKEIANQVFQSRFNYTNITEFLNLINEKQDFQYLISKTLIFKNKIDGTLLLGKIIDVQIDQNLCEPEIFIVQDIKNNKVFPIKPSRFFKSEVNLNGLYLFKKNRALLLRNIWIKNKKTDKIALIFEDLNTHAILKLKDKINLPPSLNSIKKFVKKVVFLQKENKIIIMRCVDFKIKNKVRNSLLILTSNENNEVNNKFKYKLKEIIVKPRHVDIDFINEDFSNNYLIKTLKWLKNNEIKTFFSLKKPINNIEVGFIKKIVLIDEKNKSSSLSLNKSLMLNDWILIENIFKKEIKIPFNLIHQISFEIDTGLIQKKSEVSIFSRFSYKILKKFKPEMIFYC
ncbi:MAG: M48 family metalloprotease [Promethearchaeota archaeon]